MKTIKIELFDSGLDIVFNNRDIISFASYTQLKSQINSWAFKATLRLNIIYPITHHIEIDDLCSDPTIFAENCRKFWSWIGQTP